MKTYNSYEEYPFYGGSDLGYSLKDGKSVFKLWAPAAAAAEINLYQEDAGGSAISTKALAYIGEGVWQVVISEDVQNLYYTYRTQNNGTWSQEAPDPYSIAAGRNGIRSQIIDLKSTNPPGWEQDKRPTLANKSDVIIYELHVRDLSTHESSGIREKGKYLGLTERGTINSDGLSTGLDHIIDLGVSHVHLLPVFDHRSIDEFRLDSAQFNWGYDPHLFNVPEGSYSTDPKDGKVRIKEFKQLVMAMHQAGLRVVMDVVYNHTGLTEESVFNTLVPGYYYRQRADGSFSDASACGNETASERAMVRQFIIHSVKYWVQEYHIDGFRFDLMGIHDQETMNEISSALHEIEPSIFIYGEGWTAGDSPLPEEKRSLKKYTHKLNRVAAFSDDLRDGVKGSVFEHSDQGFVSGKKGSEESIKFGIVAAGQHSSIDYSRVNYSDAPWAAEPSQCINYVACHDNHTLWDKLSLSTAVSQEDRIRMHKLANAIVFTSQGIPFLHAGAELLRTKDGEENSFKSPDSVNQINWEWKTQNRDVYEYYRDLIRLRKDHSAFRLPSNKEIQSNLSFLDVPEGLVAYVVKESTKTDNWKEITVIYNANKETININVPPGDWDIGMDESGYFPNGKKKSLTGLVAVPPISALVLFKQ